MAAFRLFFALIVALFGVAHVVNASPKPAYVCSACALVLGLVEEAAFQVRLENYLKAQCAGVSVCEFGVHQLILTLVGNVNPDDICSPSGLDVCPEGLKAFSQWPVNPLPEQPIPWPVERRLSQVTPVVAKKLADFNIDHFVHVKPVFEKLVDQITPVAGVPMMTAVVQFIANFLAHEATPQELELMKGASVGDYEPCGFNISCKIDAISNHKPLQDIDGDLYSGYAKTLRGSDWRGADCNDQRNDVYPGRAAMPADLDYNTDHNCNGIYGGNATGSYEDLFCAGTQSHGLIMLGDSATAHFHIPPQWVTAQGWNLNGFLPLALDEIDQPHCSWGTGHAELEGCPHQNAIPNLADEITSIYSQLRARNRCNHNDYQNIGVNGARVTSSDGLVSAMARQQTLDKPALVWFALIGNDVCNGHPNFESMTEPEEFYEKAMESFNRLDATLPPNSYVVSMALFEGELLYNIMHKHVHPIGCTYDDIYNFMNVLEENPCWGWLNANQTVRQFTTKRSDQLTMVYRKIEKEQNFKNFKFALYAPVWSTLFLDYQKAGHPLTDLIEPVDGFHPSQTGNAIFAQKIFEWLETEHPEALGPVNPHNEEIDRLFFKDLTPQGHKKK